MGLARSRRREQSTASTKHSVHAAGYHRAMAEDHRRVEARQIVGTGMATDADRITRIADDAARRERAWRNARATCR